MIRRLPIIGFVLFFVCILSCGPTEQERMKIEKAKLDSVATAVKKSMEDSILLNSRFSELKREKGIAEDAIGLFRYAIQTLKERQVLVQIELEKSKSFQLGRTVSEKEAQISDLISEKDRLDARLKATEVGLKVFKLALLEMDGMESKRFKNLEEFQVYSNELKDRITKAEKEAVIDVESNYMNDFSYFKLIKEESFIRSVAEFKRGKIPDID